jgi:hypothetical protein
LLGLEKDSEDLDLIFEGSSHGIRE